MVVDMPIHIRIHENNLEKVRTFFVTPIQCCNQFKYQMFKHIDRKTNTYSMYKLRPSTSLTPKTTDFKSNLGVEQPITCVYDNFQLKCTNPDISKWVYFQILLIQVQYFLADPFQGTWNEYWPRDVYGNLTMCEKNCQRIHKNKLFLWNFFQPYTCLSLYEHLHKIHPHEFIIKFQNRILYFAG